MALDGDQRVILSRVTEKSLFPHKELGRENERRQLYFARTSRPLQLFRKDSKQLRNFLRFRNLGQPKQETKARANGTEVAAVHLVFRPWGQGPRGRRRCKKLT